MKKFLFLIIVCLLLIPVLNYANMLGIGFMYFEDKGTIEGTDKTSAIEPYGGRAFLEIALPMLPVDLKTGVDFLMSSTGVSYTYWNAALNETSENLYYLDQTFLQLYALAKYGFSVSGINPYIAVGPSFLLNISSTASSSMQLPSSINPKTDDMRMFLLFNIGANIKISSSLSLIPQIDYGICLNPGDGISSRTIAGGGLALGIGF